MRCYTGVSNFFSLDPACEGTQVVGALGYLSTVQDSRTARPLWPPPRSSTHPAPPHARDPSHTQAAQLAAALFW